MCLTIAELVMFVGGLYALIAGKVKLTKNITLEGWRARVAGLFLIAPFPIGFLIGVVLGIFIASGTIPPTAKGYMGIVEFVLVLLGLAGAAIFGAIVKQNEGSSERTVEEM